MVAAVAYRKPRQGLRDRWIDAVLRHPDLSDACKVTLLAMATWMTDAGYVSVPRAVLAQMLGKHPSRISEHVGAAVRAKLLDKRGGGRTGVTARYEAVLPTSRGYL